MLKFPVGDVQENCASFKFYCWFIVVANNSEASLKIIENIKYIAQKMFIRVSLCTRGAIPAISRWQDLQIPKINRDIWVLRSQNRSFLMVFDGV